MNIDSYLSFEKIRNNFHLHFFATDRRYLLRTSWQNRAGASSKQYTKLEQQVFSKSTFSFNNNRWSNYCEVRRSAWYKRYVVSISKENQHSKSDMHLWNFFDSSTHVKRGRKLFIRGSVKIQDKYLQLTAENTSFEFGSNKFSRPLSSNHVSHLKS